MLQKILTINARAWYLLGAALVVGVLPALLQAMGVVDAVTAMSVVQPILAVVAAGMTKLLLGGARDRLRHKVDTSLMIGSVLAGQAARSALFSTSDLSRVRVTRVNAATGQLREWLLDCSSGNNPNLWLRDGDVIEVPDKP